MTSRPLPRETVTRLQYLIDEGDATYFAAHPSETVRRRMYFLGERTEGDDEPSRYVRVTREGDGLVRRFTAERGDA